MDAFDSPEEIKKEITPEAKRKLTGVYIMVGAILIASTLLIVLFLHPYPILKTQVIELGETISLDPDLYWDGLNVKAGTIDDSSVNYSEVGYYHFTGHAGISDYDFTVEIVDTTAPVISLLGTNLYYKIYETYYPEDFINQVTDLAPVKVCIVYNHQEVNKVTFHELGNYEIMIKATDKSGNVADVTVSFLVDESPRLFGVNDVFVKSKTHFDPLEGVLAVDTTDGNCTKNISVDASQVDIARPGQYTVFYDVADKYGLHTTKERLVVVGNDGAKEFPEEYLTEEDLQLLCQYECFDYDPFKENMKKDEVEALIEPSLVNLFWDKGGGSWMSGSGFIYDITPNWIYIGSVKHVAKNCQTPFYVTFYDRVAVYASSLCISNDSDDNELSLIRISTLDVPVDTLLKLREIYAEESSTVYDSLETGDELIAYAKHWCRQKDVVTTCKLTNLLYSQDNHGGANYIQTSPAVKSGMSGTAVVDMRGRLVGVVSYTYYSADRTQKDYHCRVDHIDQLAAREQELEPASNQ